MTNQETFYKAIEALDIPELTQLEIKYLANTYASAQWQSGFAISQDINSKTKSVLG